MNKPAYSAFAALTISASALFAPFAQAQSVVFQGDTFTNHGLVGVGRIAADTLDSFGETFGSFSAFYLDQASWSRNGGSYSGTLYTQPDRGYNVNATSNYVPRFNQLSFTFTPAPAGAASQNQVALSIVSTTLFKESGGTPLTSLDPTPTGTGSRPALTSQPLPQAVNGRLSLDAEGIVRRPDGTMYVSDEYGPYVYRFAADGTLLSVLQSPAALLPQRAGATSFSSNNPGVGEPAPSPLNPASGRQNNQGLEGLTITPDGTKLVALLQSAARQDLNTGGVPASRGNTRMLVYDLASDPANPTLIAEHVVQLPTYAPSTNNSGGVGAPVVAAQSELLALNDTQFLLLARDGRGNGLDNTGTANLDEGRSDFRQVLLLDISGATNIAGTAFDNLGASIAPNGVLNNAITPATSAPFVDLNNALELAKFDLGNGSSFGADNLSEKWEALALASTLDEANPNDYFLFVGNDNDFKTRSGLHDGEAYDAGYENDNMILVYHVTLPTAGFAAIPEPSTFAAIAGLGALGLACARRRRSTGR
jgi:hypothetical protein